MSRHSLFTEDPGTAIGLARPETPDPGVVPALSRAHLDLGRDDLPSALEMAQRLSLAQGGWPDPADMLVEDALAQAHPSAARAVLALVEPQIPAPQAAAIKARIALAEDDFAAAKAILVMAIERGPDHPGLRALLTEVMVAAGTAAEARAVLAHIGQPPVNPPATPSAPGARIDQVQPR